MVNPIKPLNGGKVGLLFARSKNFDCAIKSAIIESVMRLKKFHELLKKPFAYLSPSACLIVFLAFVSFLIINTIRHEMTPPVVLPALAVVPKLKSERQIPASAARVDATCASLPTPEQFDFVSKTAPTETDRFVSIAYTFRSSRETPEIYPTFILWFTQNGWTDNKPVYVRLEFSKGNQTVWLAPFHTKAEGDFYTVSCTEWKGVSADD